MRWVSTGNWEMEKPRPIAEMYEKGERLPQSFQRASYSAQWKLGRMFENGHGVDLNVQRAVIYFKTSARG